MVIGKNNRGDMTVGKLMAIILGVLTITLVVVGGINGWFNPIIESITGTADSILIKLKNTGSVEAEQEQAEIYCYPEENKDFLGVPVNIKRCSDKCSVKTNQENQIFENYITKNNKPLCCNFSLSNDNFSYGYVSDITNNLPSIQQVEDVWKSKPENDNSVFTTDAYNNALKTYNEELAPYYSTAYYFSSTFNTIEEIKDYMELADNIDDLKKLKEVFDAMHDNYETLYMLLEFGHGKGVLGISANKNSYLYKIDSKGGSNFIVTTYELVDYSGANKDVSSSIGFKQIKVLQENNKFPKRLSVEDYKDFTDFYNDISSSKNELLFFGDAWNTASYYKFSWSNDMTEDIPEQSFGSNSDDINLKKHFADNFGLKVDLKFRDDSLGKLEELLEQDFRIINVSENGKEKIIFSTNNRNTNTYTIYVPSDDSKYGLTFFPIKSNGKDIFYGYGLYDTNYNLVKLNETNGFWELKIGEDFVEDFIINGKKDETYINRCGQKDAICENTIKFLNFYLKAKALCE